MLKKKHKNELLIKIGQQKRKTQKMGGGMKTRKWKNMKKV